MENKKIKILYVSAEVSPFSKVGGLADVAGSLPKALSREDCDIRVITPKYSLLHDNNLKIVKNMTVPFGADFKFPVIHEGVLEKSETPVYCIEENSLLTKGRVYGDESDVLRFSFFNLCVLEACKYLDFQPDIIHINDWQSCFIPVLLKTKFKHDPYFDDVKALLTIHNLRYQGNCDQKFLEYFQIDTHDLESLYIDLQDGDVNFCYEGILNADSINTVSENYRNQILTPQYGEGLDMVLASREKQLFGIVNGIDQDVWNPKTDKYLDYHYDFTDFDGKLKNKWEIQKMCSFIQDESIPLFSMVTRIADQKGFDILIPVLQKLFEANCSMQVVVLGTGDESILEKLEFLESDYPDHIRIISEFNEELGHKLYAGSDFFLMPSKFEPCGLGQMMAMKYGSVPIVHATGGLADTVKPYDGVLGSGNGFVFHTYACEDLQTSLSDAFALYKNTKAFLELQKKCMKQDFSWNISAVKYRELYKKILS